MKNYITVATFVYPHEFAVLRLLLEQENIRHFFQNETMVSVFPFYSNALGGIHLKVHPEDQIRAKEILRQLDNSSHLRIV